MYILWAEPCVSVFREVRVLCLWAKRERLPWKSLVCVSAPLSLIRKGSEGMEASVGEAAEGGGGGAQEGRRVKREGKWEEGGIDELEVKGEEGWWSEGGGGNSPRHEDKHTQNFNLTDISLWREHDQSATPSPCVKTFKKPYSDKLARDESLMTPVGKLGHDSQREWSRYELSLYLLTHPDRSESSYSV